MLQQIAFKFWSCQTVKLRRSYLSMVFLGLFHLWSGVVLYQRLDDLHAWNCFSKWSEEGSVKGKLFQFYFAHPDCEEKSTSATFAVGSPTFHSMRRTITFRVWGRNSSKKTTATKGHLKKWMRAASNLIALIPSRSIRQMLAIFSRAEF